jgi:hypothetical protein
MKKLCTLAAALLFAAFALGATPAPPGKYEYLNVDEKGNQKLTDSFGSGTEGNDLGALKKGVHTSAGINFQVGEKVIQLGSKLLQKNEKPNKVEGIKVGQSFAKLHILHSTEFGEGGAPIEEGTKIAEYKVLFDDGSSESIPVVYGQDVRDWWFYPQSKEVSRGKVGWKGANEYSKSFNAEIHLYVLTWENPHPAKKVATITYAKTDEEGVAAPFCVALTVEPK